MPTKIEKDDVTGIETTGHEWDGIKELNAPLPKWWLYLLYATIIWSVGYYVLYPSWPWLSGYAGGLLGYSSRVELTERMSAARAAQAGFYARIDGATPAEIAADAELLNFALSGGRTMFNENCAPCHGAGGAGAKGYPSLADDEWLWGGDIEAIEATIRYGIRSDHDETRVSDMPRFGLDEILDEDEIAAVSDYVLAFTGAADATEQGAEIYADNCASCHGDEGEGIADFGAPALNDAIWLFGGDRESIVTTVTEARGAMMPAWQNRLDPATIKMLTVYVHSLGGGE